MTTLAWHSPAAARGGRAAGAAATSRCARGAGGARRRNFGAGGRRPAAPRRAAARRRRGGARSGWARPRRPAAGRRGPRRAVGDEADQDPDQHAGEVRRGGDGQLALVHRPDRAGHRADEARDRAVTSATAASDRPTAGASADRVARPVASTRFAPSERARPRRTAGAEPSRRPASATFPGGRSAVTSSSSVSNSVLSMNDAELVAFISLQRVGRQRERRARHARSRPATGREQRVIGGSANGVPGARGSASAEARGTPSGLVAARERGAGATPIIVAASAETGGGGPGGPPRRRRLGTRRGDDRGVGRLRRDGTGTADRPPPRQQPRWTLGARLLHVEQRHPQQRRRARRCR